MDTNWAYNENVKKHFMTPKNMLAGAPEDYHADGEGSVGSPACGDMMMVLIKVKDERIADFKWKTFGCASAIASTSALSELVLENGGMKLDDAYRVTPEQIISYLGGLPANKIHCSVLGDKALQAAIDDYYAKNNLTNPIKKAESPIVCQCLNVSEEDIRMEVLEGATNWETLQERTKIGTVCGKCQENAKQIQANFVKRYYSEKTYNPDKEA